MATFIAPLPARRGLCTPQTRRWTCRLTGPRPALDDVERLSRGQAAKRRGTGSRAVPHRLNAIERKEYEAAARKGYATIDAAGRIPLYNIWRMWNDARAQPAVILLRRTSGDMPDVVRVDMSTMRAPSDEVAGRLDACVEAVGERRASVLDNAETNGDFTPTWAIGERTVDYSFFNRVDAKAAAKRVALMLGTQANAQVKSTRKPNRRHPRIDVDSSFELSRPFR